MCLLLEVNALISLQPHVFACSPTTVPKACDLRSNRTTKRFDAYVLLALELLVYALPMILSVSQLSWCCAADMLHLQGYYQGKRNCDETVDAMKACIKKYKLYPFDIK